MAKYLFLIHGYSADSEETWGNFPKLISEHLGGTYTVDFITYTSPPKWMFWKHGPSHLNIAESAITRLRHRCANFETDEVVLVGHSNGGIVAKKILQQLNLSSIRHNITKLCFLDVPHSGSFLANLGSPLNPRNKHLKVLKGFSDELNEINMRWEKEGLESKIRVLNLVASDDDVVPAMSSRHNYQDTITVPNVNHSLIAKPENKDSIVVLELVKFLKSSPRVKKYLNNTSRTYSAWRRHDRHHHLSYVEDIKRESALKSLISHFSSNQPLVRLSGLSGLGKSRLIVEYIEKEQYPEELVLIYNASLGEGNVLDTVTSVVDDNFNALIVIENCSVGLHNQLIRICGNNNVTKIVTVDFYHDKVNSHSHIKLDRLAEEQIIHLIKQRLPESDDTFVYRLARFVEGFPLLVDMLVENIKQTGELSSEFTEDGLVEKLINGDNQLIDSHRELLKVMSLFDYFQCEKELHEENNHDKLLLKKISKANDIDFDSVITNFSQKELINRSGRFARVAPKPLALNLAMQWWNSSLFERQSELVNSLPETLIDSFCKQITFLDSSIKVQDFVKNFCESDRPFAQAELLLSGKGSRLFRALVEVNPHETSALLYRVFTLIGDAGIESILGDARRNLVWALEMLVFHADCFNKAAWCLFKLAQFENETYSNNATGQFCQMFRWQLSGTGASFSQRITLLDNCFNLNSVNVDKVIIAAIESAINIRGGTRTIGAERQGTKEELKEWMPETWNELYNYWGRLFDLLLKILNRGKLNRLVKDAFGPNIRGLIQYKQYEQLDNFLRDVIKVDGKYWPSAMQSINHVLLYNREGMDDEQISHIEAWKQLLSPDAQNVEEQIKLLVLDPSREHVKGDDGHYIDVAAVEAKKLACDLKHKLSNVIQHLELLLTFPIQRQSWIFGKQLIQELSSEDAVSLINEVLEFLAKNDVRNIQFFSGIMNGLYIISQELWLKVLDQISQQPTLFIYYPDALKTGKFSVGHLKHMVELMKSNVLETSEAVVLSYGGATDHLNEMEIAEFCKALSHIDNTGAWVALQSIEMYLHGRSDIDSNHINPVLRSIVLSLSFDVNSRGAHVDMYHWHQAVVRLLKTENEDFAMSLCNRLIEQVSNSDVEYSALLDYLAPAFYAAIELYPSSIWREVSNRFTDEKTLKPYRLIDLLGSRGHAESQDKSIFNLLNIQDVIHWCEDEVALLIVARATKLIIGDGDDRLVNPLLIRLLEIYGESEAFKSEISAHFYSRSWTGSLIPYLEVDRQIIALLTNHHNGKVSYWASNFIENINAQIDHERKREVEYSILRN
ncbi:PGAP1-like alpha/beta domain-containing protein [Rheinheimera faecalis]|uniref:PGAP1-like alpha/beta domain-containing protein n=1 Tax=Rheinheimera faecalis TaxID=2901141 RepID=UPI001E57523E|nr:hypothetical protein [Rheinheimera faecalis]